MNESGSFSTIKFFKLFEAKLKALNQYPLTLDNLNIQQDAYKRLGAEDDRISGDDEPFATLLVPQKETDNNVRFAVEFKHNHILMDIEYVGQQVVVLERLFHDEKDAAEQIFAFCTMLCNGQIRLLHTTNNGYGCALEVLLQPTQQDKPIVISTQSKYPWWWSMERQGYDVHVKKNAYIKKYIKIPKNFFACEFDSNGAIVPNGRVIGSKIVTPLTKQKAAVLNNVQREMLFATDKDPERPKQAWSNWEFWVVAGLYSALIGIGYKEHWFGFLADYPFVFGILGVSLVQTVTAMLIARKKILQEEAPDHPYVKIDAVLGNLSPGWMTSGVFAAVFVLMFFPIFYDSVLQRSVNLFVLARRSWWVMFVPIGLLVSMLLSIKESAKSKWALTLVGISSIGLLIYANSTLGGSVDVPEPLNSIAGLITLAAPVFIIGNVIAYYKRHRMSQAANGSAVKEDRKRDEDKLAKRKALFIATEQVLWSVAGIGTLISAGLFYGKVPAESLKVPPTLYCALIAIVGVTGLVMTHVYRLKLISPSSVTWIALGLFFAYLLIPAFCLKENVANEGPNLAYVIIFSSAFLGAFGTAVREAYTSRIIDRNIKDEIRGN